MTRARSLSPCDCNLDLHYGDNHNTTILNNSFVDSLKMKWNHVTTSGFGIVVSSFRSVLIRVRVFWDKLSKATVPMKIVGLTSISTS